MHLSKIFVLSSFVFSSLVLSSLSTSNTFARECPPLAGTYGPENSDLIITQKSIDNFTQFTFRSSQDTLEESQSENQIVETNATEHTVGKNHFKSFNYCTKDSLWIATWNSTFTLTFQQFTLHPTADHLTIKNWIGMSQNEIKKQKLTEAQIKKQFKNIGAQTPRLTVPMEIHSADGTAPIADTFIIYLNEKSAPTVLQRRAE